MFHIILTTYRGIFRLVRSSLHNFFTGWVVRCTCWVVSNPMHIMMQIVLELDTLYHVCLLRPCPANPHLGMTPTMSRQSFFYYDTNYAPLIILLLWHRLCPTNPSFSITLTALPILLLVWHWPCPNNPYLGMMPTKPGQSLFGYDPDYAQPILI